MHGTAAVRSVAEYAGADPDQVIEDVETDRYYPVVDDDRSQGSDTGVQGTPAVFVDGEPVRSSYEAVASAVADAR
jgi:DSBA-like thioredoxin domain.